MSEKDYSKSPNLPHFSNVFQFESLKKWVWRIWMLVLLTFYPDSFLARLEKLFHNNFLTQMQVSFAFFPSHIFIPKLGWFLIFPSFSCFSNARCFKNCFSNLSFVLWSILITFFASIKKIKMGDKHLTFVYVRPNRSSRYDVSVTGYFLKITNL